MKYIVETNGSYQYLTPGGLVKHEGPSLVFDSGFLQNRIHEGNIKVHRAKLPDSADSNEFLKFIRDCEGDFELAIASFCSKFEKKKKPGPKPKPKPEVKAK